MDINIKEEEIRNGVKGTRHQSQDSRLKMLPCQHAIVRIHAGITQVWFGRQRTPTGVLILAVVGPQEPRIEMSGLQELRTSSSLSVVDRHAPQSAVFYCGRVRVLGENIYSSRAQCLMPLSQTP